MVEVNAVWWGVHIRAGLMMATLAAGAAAVYAGRPQLVKRFGARLEVAKFGARMEFFHIPALIGGQAPFLHYLWLGLGYYLWLRPSAMGLGYYLWLRPSIVQTTKHLMGENALTEIFQEHYRMEIAEGDEFLLSVWKRVMPRLQLAMRTVGIRAIGHASRRDNDYLQRILSEDVPRLRRQFARAIGDTAAVTPALQEKKKRKQKQEKNTTTKKKKKKKKKRRKKKKKKKKT
ncbi:hypothetical protein T484DRAFT_1797536 [Baffinella frigidus]|nr:hypothetical protein T484DRAFT_1797536 [Cryptophyta sp. CCMP2293]